MGCGFVICLQIDSFCDPETASLRTSKMATSKMSSDYPQLPKLLGEEKGK